MLWFPKYKTHISQCKLATKAKFEEKDKWGSNVASLIPTTFYKQ